MPRPELGGAVHVDMAGDDPIAIEARLRGPLVPEAFHGGFDHRALFDLMVDGRSVFRRPSE